MCLYGTWNCHSWPLDVINGEVDLQVNLLIWAVTIETWNCHSWPLDVSTWGVDLPLDLLMCTLTSLLHVKLGKYKLSGLKSFILIWGVVRVFYIWHYFTMLTDCLLLKLFSNKKNSHLFLMNLKWLPNTSHNIYAIMHLWVVGVDLPVDVLIWNLKLPFLATRCQGGRSANMNSNIHITC